MDARYVFGVTIRLESTDRAVTLEPTTVEGRCAYTAPPPGTDGWRLFQDLLWRGSLSEPTHARSVVDDWLEPPVSAVSFRALHTDADYFEALKAEIADDLSAFNADNVQAVISKYFGSSVIVEDSHDSHH